MIAKALFGEAKVLAMPGDPCRCEMHGMIAPRTMLS